MAHVDHKVVLIVIDGWGIASPSSRGDAIAAADTPVMSGFADAAQGYTQLDASSLAVGLPEGLMGNSEVGHLNIGAGRVVWQDSVRIDQTLKAASGGGAGLAGVANIVRSFERAKHGNGRLHLLGLVSDGGVHSKLAHLLGLLRLAAEMHVPQVFVHAFADGRDTDPKSGAGFLQQLVDAMRALGSGHLATVVGRYYAMDRDRRWDRIELAMAALVSADAGQLSADPVETVRQRYAAGETDEFLKPIISSGGGGGSNSRIQDGDTLFFFNYRSDRVRELTQLLGDYDRSPRPHFAYPADLHITTMTQYKTDFAFPVAFAPQHMGNVLAEWLSKQGLRQCHVAETEKYAHVTFFFNGGIEKQFPGEERDMVPSPKVATYDLQPEMSADQVGRRMAARIAQGDFHFLMNNFAPPDMVGHTGVYEAAVRGVAATDRAIGHVYDACRQHGYILFVTADHGNAEEMLNENGGPKTSHTLNKVPFVMANAPAGWSLRKEHGVLGDVAPTVLAAMGVDQPAEMTGQSLLIK